MEQFRRDFITFAIANRVLQFGRFTLKSGRVSPYFFNSGLFNDGASVSALGRFYRQAIEHAGLRFDMLFGPAYKGIPLVTALAIAYSGEGGRALPYCFNRKEEKDHGEGGILAGAPLQGAVLIVDDVVTAGTSARFSVDLIARHGARPAALVIALDRQECGPDGIDAVADIQQRYGMPVCPIITLDNLIEFLQANPQHPEYAMQLPALLEHRRHASR